jgi:hypothetical protein
MRTPPSSVPSAIFDAYRSVLADPDFCARMSLASGAALALAGTDLDFGGRLLQPPPLAGPGLVFALMLSPFHSGPGAIVPTSSSMNFAGSGPSIR